MKPGIEKQKRNIFINKLEKDTEGRITKHHVDTTLGEMANAKEQNLTLKRKWGIRINKVKSAGNCNAGLLGLAERLHLYRAGKPQINVASCETD